MSYSLTIKVTSGTAVVESQNGTIPDGVINISGHGDDTHQRVGITVVQPDGMPVVQATGVSHPYPFAPSPETPEAVNL